MSFADDAAFMVAGLHEWFGVSALYVGPGVSDVSVSCDVVLRRDPPQFVEDEYRRSHKIYRGLVKINSLSTTPVQDGRFTIGSETWTVEYAPALKAGCWHCECKRISLDRLGEKRENVSG